MICISHYDHVTPLPLSNIPKIYIMWYMMKYKKCGIEYMGLDHFTVWGAAISNEGSESPIVINRIELTKTE